MHFNAFARENTNISYSIENINLQLLSASKNGLTKTVRELITKGADIGVKDCNGRTPLVNASLNGHTEIVQILTDIT